jgi:hypothetical protein
LFVESTASYYIDWYQDAASEYRQHEEDVPQHPQKTQEDDGVEADFLYQLILLDISDCCNPAERLTVELSRSMFVVGVFSARGIDTRVAGSEDAEEEEEGAGDGKCVDDGGVNGVLLDLG